MTVTAGDTEHGTPARRRARTLEVRRAAARMVIAASEANGETPDPKIVAIAEGKTWQAE